MAGAYSTSCARFFHPHFLPLKGLFFFEQGSAACLLPYIPIFLQYLGLNAAENGIIFGTLPFIALISKPSAGAMADRAHTPYAILRLFLVVQLVFTAVLCFIPKMDDLTVLTLTNQTGDLANQTIQSAANFSTAQPMNISSNRSTELPAKSEDFFRWTTQFWLTGLILLIAWFSYGAVNTLEDIITYRTVQTAPIQSTYGANRVVGTAGFACASLLVGVLLNNYSETSSPKDREFAPAFIAYVVLGCLGLSATVFMRSKAAPGASQRTDTVAVKVPVTEEVDEVEPFPMAEFVLFGMGTFVVGACTGLLFGYLAWYQSDLGASNFLLGLAVFAQCFYEAPMMAMSGYLIERIGHHGCTFLALFSFALRFIAYSYLLPLNPWLVLITEIAHSFGFGLYYSAMTSFAHEHAPPEISGTLQGVLGATYEGFGLGIGGLAGGFLYLAYGGQTTWLGYGMVAGVCAAVYLPCALFLWRRRSRRSRSRSVVVDLTDNPPPYLH